MASPNFLQYFVKETGKNFTELKNEVSEIKQKLDDLLMLKSQLTNDARWRTWLISAFTGAFTFVVSTGVTVWVSRSTGQPTNSPTVTSTQAVSLDDTLVKSLESSKRSTLKDPTGK
jgi:hypothetical protein